MGWDIPVDNAESFWRKGNVTHAIINAGRENESPQELQERREQAEALMRSHGFRRVFQSSARGTG